MREINAHRTQTCTPDHVRAMGKSLHGFQRELFFKLFDKTIVQEMLVCLLSKELLPKEAKFNRIQNIHGFICFGHTEL